MDIDVSVGPYADRIGRLPGSLSSVELVLGKGKRPPSAVERIDAVCAAGWDGPTPSDG